MILKTPDSRSGKSSRSAKSKSFSSIEEWGKKYIPETLEMERYKKLADNPETLAKILAQKIFQEIEEKYSL